MKHRQLWQGTFASLGMLLLILDGRTALEGASSGIDLCMKTVIPSLFPFFLLSVLLTNALSGANPFFRPLSGIFQIPQGTETLLLTGFLGGYPVGAQCVASGWKNGQLSKADANRMLAFCSNAGPAFLFGMVSPMFPSPGYAWLLWGIQIASALLVAISITRDVSAPVGLLPKKTISVSAALHSSLSIMASVCGWVVIFRVVIAFLDRWIFWLFPAPVTTLLTGLLELSNGCCLLSCVADCRIRFVICAVILTFGGVCVTMQTMSVISGLDGRVYLLGKLLQSTYALLLCLGICYRVWTGCFAAIMVLLFFLRRTQKSSSIPKKIGV